MTDKEPRRDPGVAEMQDLSSRLEKVMEDEDLSEESITTINIAAFTLGWLWGQVYALKSGWEK